MSEDKGGIKSSGSTSEWWKRGRGYYYDGYDDTPRGGYGGGYSYGYGYGYGGTSSYYSGYHYGGSYYGGGGFYDRRRSSLGISSSTSKLTASVSGTKFSNATELMSKAYKETRDMIVILDFPFEVKVAFSKNDISGIKKNNTRYVYLSTKVIDDSSRDDSTKINIICGNGVHEACHLKFTSKLVLDGFFNKIDTLPPDIKEEAKELRKGNVKFIKMITNLVEDMRVENELLLERPGYSDLLSTAKDYGLSKYKESLSYVSFVDKEAGKFLDNLVRLIRYPEEIDEDVISKHSEAYTEIKNLITPLPSSTKDTCKAALGVFKIVSKHFTDLTSKSDLPESDSKDTSMTVEIGEAFDRMVSAIADVADSSCTSIVLSGEDAQEEGGSTVLESELSRRTAPILNDKTAPKVVTGEIETGKRKNTYFHKPEGNSSDYRKCVKRVQKYIPAIRKLIKGHDKNYDFNIYGCRSGLLDTSKLAEAFQGIPQVYIRKGEVRTNKLAVGILVDESGSMGDYSYYSGDGGYSEVNGYVHCTRSFIARDTAILLNEAIKTLPGVDLYIYGHSADLTCTGATEIYIYREKNYTPDISMSKINGRMENRDGTAIIEVAERIRKYTQDPGVLFVISDGSPSACGYRGYEAIKDTARRVKEAEKLGFAIIQISIGYVDGVKEMFKNYVDLTGDMSTLPKSLSNVVKKAIVDNKKTTIK